MARILLSSVIFCSMLLLVMAWDFNHNLNVTRKYDVVKQSANVNYTNILNFWKDHKNEFILNEHDKHDEVVLIMGNTGAGKTTLVSALTGRKLRSIMSNGYYVIVDDEDRIGTGISSKTLIPEIMTDKKRNVTYVDCSGFRDNRNFEYEISSIYFQNILMNQVERIKFIFVINYESLKVNGNKNDFDDLFEHIGEFIKNISKFHDGIALVATKVENTYGQSDGTFFLLNDNQTVLKGIADYLKNKKETYRSKTENPEKYKQFVDLIDILLQKNNDSFTRIAIFRQPNEEGLLENIKTTKNEIDIIRKMTTENLRYVEKRTDDFGYALSKSSIETIDEIVDDIFRDVLVNCLHKISNEILTHYWQIEKQYSDIEILRERVSQAYNIITSIKKANEPQKLFQEFLNAANTLNITVSLTNLNIISNDIKALKFFTTVLNSNKDTHMFLLENEMQSVIKSIENSKIFYDFLNNLQQNLATYESQNLKNDNRIANIIASCTNSKYKAVQNITDLESIVKEIGSDYIYQKIKTLELHQFQLKHLKAVFGTFSSELECFCASSSKQMTVKGYNVKMSDVVKIDCWVLAKNIQVFALNKVFIDCTIDKTGAEAQLFILAPTWEVEGEQKIILDGNAGEPHKERYAKSALFNSKNGMDGLPGNPGGSAGNFFGVGRQFTNLEHLEINGNGGKGGPGQHGGSGANGIAGEELAESFFASERTSNAIQEYLIDHHFEYTFSRQRNHINEITPTTVFPFSYFGDVLGKSAIKPSDGGNGGVGGLGGYPGQIMINGLGNLVKIKVLNNSGSIGLEGKGGHGGKKTSNGRRVQFMYNYYTGIQALFYSPYYSNIEWIDGADIPAGRDGKPNSNKNNQIYPTKLSLVSPYLVINSFKEFVRMNLFENIKESELRALINKLENDIQIKAQYDTLAFVKEFMGLENQYLEMRNRINFVQFYDLFLIRIEEFSKTEQILENKKVLSYIYTAALTKVFTLKKKRKGKTVVNLSKYLNTIEMNIKDIRESQHLQIVRNYRDDYKNTLNNKIWEANDFIENKIEPKINRIWEESDGQIKAIIDEIEENKNSTNDAIALLKKNKAKIRNAMKLRSMLLPFKLVASALSFFGPIGARIGTAVTSATSIAEGMLVTTSDLERNKIYPINPNLKLISRVTEVYNSKPQQLVNKFTIVIETLERYKEELSTTKEEKIVLLQQIEDWKIQLNEVRNKQVYTIIDVDYRKKGAEKIEKQINEFINSRKDILERETSQFNAMKEEKENSEKLEKEAKIKKFIRAIDHIQSILGSVEVVFNFVKQLKNNEEEIENINNQISSYIEQLRDLEKLEAQVYNIVIPDFLHIEKMINAIEISINGSSHAKLDLTKWTVRNTLRDMKSLLQKFTYKMSFELQNNLKHYMEKIDEGFSILIDIYDRIDSYSDSVKQAEYMAHIVSAPMMNVQVTNSDLSDAMIDLKFIIQSNILFEKYGIALHAFKQHYFPFAAHILQKFQLPTSLQLNDIETLRSNIIEKIKDMKNHIDESDATIDEYSKFIHTKSVFNSNTTGSLPFYVWKHNIIKNELQKLLSGAEILIKADISRGVYHNAVKYSDIGINFKLNNENLQNSFTSVLKNFALTMTMVGNNYYRCGEQYYFISFDDDITISYTLNQNEEKNWIDPNLVYTTILGSRPFLSPYGMWSIKLTSINKSASFDHLNVYVDEMIDLELIGRGYYIEQNSQFNFDICSEYLGTFYDVENIAKVLV